MKIIKFLVFLLFQNYKSYKIYEFIEWWIWLHTVIEWSIAFNWTEHRRQAIHGEAFPGYLWHFFDCYKHHLDHLYSFQLCQYIFHHLENRKRAAIRYEKDINLVIHDKNSGDFPFFQVFRKKSRNSALKKTESKEQNLNAVRNQNGTSGHNIVELKCTKCSYTT